MCGIINGVCWELRGRHSNELAILWTYKGGSRVDALDNYVLVRNGGGLAKATVQHALALILKEPLEINVRCQAEITPSRDAMLYHRMSFKAGISRL